MPFYGAKTIRMNEALHFLNEFLCFLVSVRPPSFFASSQVHGQIEKASKERSRLLFFHKRSFSQSLRQLLVLFMTLHDFLGIEALCKGSEFLFGLGVFLGHLRLRFFSSYSIQNLFIL